MSETTLADGAARDPVINVIERAPSLEEGGAGGAREGLDRPAAEAMDARRRREFDAVRARLREQAMRNDPGQAQPGDSRTQAADRASAPLGEAPERVRKRYLRAGNQYFLKDAPYQMAFEDLGPYLVSQHNRPDVVESMVDMVKAKSWERILVSGHEEFRREVWLQATLLGLQVSGYQPKVADLARLGESRRELMNSRVAYAGETLPRTNGTRPPAPAADPVSVAPAVDAAPASRTARSHIQTGAAAQAAPGDAREATAIPAPRRTTGNETRSDTGHETGREMERKTSGQDEPDVHRYTDELVEYGSAPYQHNPARNDSYYVVYRDGAGADHAVWGVVLERAIAESGATRGERVTLQNFDKRWVSIDVPVVEATGQIIGYEEKEVYRNTWQVDVEGQERAASLSSRGVSGRESGTESERQSGSGSGRESPADAGGGGPAVSRTQHPGRSGDAVDSQRAMQMAVIVAAMRAQGFSDRSIGQVEPYAGKLYDTFRAEGVPVPTPRVFDPKAPSTRFRAPRPAPGRSAERELERTPSGPDQPSL
ncbi:LPD7 domain-containing protein [Caballeronia sp. SBC2]|uniref:LPD7 domain-containing protein n=1 Tax=Caballeronia sp. SBC2 TaxID=2705547 RepID=UPI0013E18709|nr:LPD7 domain-containing protein [Caballeronia sp. SBC2]QIE24671.1 Large polyvalent protein-associated domain 7 [Caballeronia sp. SBC2]